MVCYDTSKGQLEEVGDAERLERERESESRKVIKEKGLAHLSGRRLLGGPRKKEMGRKQMTV